MERRGEDRHEEFVGRIARLGDLPPDRQARQSYRLSKEADGRSEGTGTFPLFGNRLQKLRLLLDGDGIFYEPIGSYDNLLELSGVNYRLLRGRAPDWALTNLMVSVRLFESAYGAALGALPLPKPGEAEQGVHQVALCGHDDRSGGLLFANWWGGEWGNDGGGVLSREYLERYMVEAWLGRLTGVGPTRFTLPLLRRYAANPQAYANTWVSASRSLGGLRLGPLKRRLRHDGAEHVVRIRETLSASDDPVEMIELHGPSDVPLGWAHLHHPAGPGSRSSVCQEFFVWPGARRRGYGRLLEELVAERAEKRGSERLEIPFHEADDYPGGARAAKAFAKGAGYGWSWTFRQKPNVSAVAERSL